MTNVRNAQPGTSLIVGEQTFHSRRGTLKRRRFLLFLLAATIVFSLGPVKAAVSFTSVILESEQAPRSKKLADVDGDGYLDVLTGGGTVQGTSVYWYEYPSWTKHLVGSIGGGEDLQTGDVNSDGALDIIVSGGIYWYENPLGSNGNVLAQWPVHEVDSANNAHDVIAEDINNDGRLDIVARGEFGPTFLYLQSTPASWLKVAMTQAAAGLGMGVGDVDRDGRLDIVQNGYWLKQPPDAAGGTWTKHDFAVWPDGASVEVGDINKDGRLDVVLAPLEHSQIPAGSGSVTWFESPPDAIQGVWSSHTIGSAQEVHGIRLADIDRDGEVDLVFAEMHQSDTHRLGIYFNDSLGASWTAQILSTSGGHNVDAGDVGRDGDIDILSANWDVLAADGGDITVWRNEIGSAGSLSLDDWTYIQADSTRIGKSLGLTFGDISGDGRLDIIAGRYWYRNPGGNLTGLWARAEFGPYDGMLALDVDNNARLDVIAEAPFGDDVGVYWLAATNAEATTWSATLIGTVPPASPEPGSQGYQLAQIIPGGHPEIVLSSGTAAWYFQVPADPFTGNWPRTEISNEVRNEGMDLADVDGDGDLDLVGFVSSSGGGVAWWENPDTAAPSWTRHDIGTTTGIEGDRIAIADINGDARKDVVVTESNLGASGNSLFWFERPSNAQTSNWTRNLVDGNQGSLSSLDIADVDLDGVPEIVTGEHRGALRVTIWKTADGGATWSGHIASAGIESHLGAQTADLDTDGDLDVVSPAWDAPQHLHIWRNDASESGPVADTIPPAISITNPLDGSTITQTSVAISAVASDNIGVASVEFFLDGVSLGLPDTSEPFSLDWITPYGLGSYSIHGVARDAAGNQTTSAIVTAAVDRRGLGLDLLAAYSFDEAGPLAFDVSGNGLHGQMVNGAARAPGQFGDAAQLNATDNGNDDDDPRVVLGTALDFTGVPITLSAWVNPEDYNDYRKILSKRDSYSSSDMRLDWGFVSGSGSVAIGQADSSVAFSYAPPVNVWTYLSVVADSTSTRLYVNGNLQETSDPIDLGNDGTANVVIGGSGDGPGGDNDPFKGGIDEVRIYSRALTQSEIATDMSTPLSSIAGSLPLVVFDGQPSGVLPAGTTSTTMSVATNNAAVCRFSSTPNTPYTAMPGIFASTGDTGHSTPLTGLAGGTTYAYFVRCRDQSGNENTADYVINFSVQDSGLFVNEWFVPAGLAFPVAVEFLPDGRMLVAELDGTIFVAPPGSNQLNATPVIQFQDVYMTSDAGLLDIEPDPDFATNGYLYVFYVTTLQGTGDRLSRVTMQGDTADPMSEIVLWQGDPDSSPYHHGAGIAFGADGKIYFTTGDHFDAPSSQDLTRDTGKLMRINLDGSIPNDNPFHDGAGPQKDAIWAYGLRNPFRMTFDAETGQLYIGDVGGNSGTSVEEVNLGSAGANYAWPICEGSCSVPGTQNPLYAYSHAGRDASIVGGLVYRGAQFPPQFQGKYFFGDYAQNWIRGLTLDPTGTSVTGLFNVDPPNSNLDTLIVGDPVDFAVGPDGSLYYVDIDFAEPEGQFNEGGIRRIRYVLNNQPPVAAASATPTTGAAPLVVNFSSAGSLDPEGQTLTYSWDFGDGQTSSESNPVHTYQTNGQFTARLTVSDGTSSASAAAIVIKAGNPPTASIAAPVDGTLFRAGDIIEYSGTATDPEDGVLAASAYQWAINFLHDTHIHPVTTFTGATGGTLTIPVSGHDFGGNTRYEIVLIVTDSDGLQSSTSAVVFPDKVDLSFNSIPTGLTLKVDGISLTAPFVKDTLKGFQHTIEAPDQTFGGGNYAFDSWSGGGAQSHQIAAPDVNQIYTAFFNETGLPSAPASLTATSVGARQIALNWSASTGTAISQYRIERCTGTGCADFVEVAGPNAIGYIDSGLSPSTTYRYRVRAASAAGVLSPYSNEVAATTSDDISTPEQAYGLEWTGDGSVRRMLYWHDPFPIYDATYIFKVYPRKKTGEYNYYTTFFWGNDGNYEWDGGGANTYYGAHPYPVPAPSGAGQWEVSVGAQDIVTGTEVEWDRWYTQAFRAWRESPSITHHEFYWDLPDTSKVIRYTIDDPNWAAVNPPTPSIHMGQAAWESYPGDEEFNGIIRGIQFYSGLLSLADIQSEIAAPNSTAAGQSLLWYLNLNPRPEDVTDKKGSGTPHNPSWRGTTAFEWIDPVAPPDVTPPTIPTTVLAVTAGIAQIDLSWDASSDNVAVTGYLLERCEGTGCTNFTEIAAPTTASYSDTGLLPSTTYSYRVRAIDAASNLSAYSTVAASTTLAVQTPPTLVTVGDKTVAEGSLLSFTVTASDADSPPNALSYSLDSGAPSGASIDAISGAFAWLPPDGPSSATLTIRATDSGVPPLSDSETITITVTNATPAVDAGSDQTAAIGMPIAFTGTFTDSGTDTHSVLWDFGDGTTADILNAAHAYGVPGTFTATLTVTDEDGAVGTDSRLLTINDDPLAVRNLQSTSSGFAIEFNRPLNPASISLFMAEPGHLGLPDVTVSGTTVGNVRGSLLVDAAAGRLHFIRSGEVLVPDTYTITIRSATDGVTDAQGGLLDGNSDGIAGDNFTTTVTIDPTAAVTLSLPDFVRGAGQAVNLVPAGGIPVFFSSTAGNIQSLSLTVVYDPALLTVLSVDPGASLPPDAQIQTDLSIPGRAGMTISSSTPLVLGPIQLVRLSAQIPADAPYRARQTVKIENVSANGGTVAGTGDAALHVAAYFADLSGNGIYSSLDVQRLLRVVTGLDTGFAPFISTDPVILADVTANGSLSSLDATRLLQEVTGMEVAEVPPLPAIPLPPPALPGTDSF